MITLKKLLAAGCLFLSVIAPVYGNVQIVNLQVEYTIEPLGIDVEKPRFFWQMDVPQQERGYSQTAWQLRVTDETGLEVWNSGKVTGGLSHHIEYQGSPLQPTTRYNWSVTVWDQKGEPHTSASWFETGLMDPDRSRNGWEGAQWIGGGDDDLPFYPAYFPVFSFQYTIQLAEGSSRGAFIYGADDQRLMDRNMNIFHLESKPGESRIELELDISAMDAQGTPARLHIYRTGYHPDDSPHEPLQTVDIPQELIPFHKRHDAHTLYVSSVTGSTDIRVNGQEERNRVARVLLNPLGEGGDFIAFPVVGHIGFRSPEGNKATFSGVIIRNFRDPGNALYEHPVPVTCSGTMQLFDPQRNSIPMLRTVFRMENKPVAKARLYVTARGIYDLYMNGQQVGDAYFNPGLTQYNKTHLYQTFDVTDHLVEGENALGAILSEGWWSGGATFNPGFWNFFGDRQSLLSKLVVTYQDGTCTTLVSDPGKWTFFNEGPVTYSSFFQGEVYDARIAQKEAGWAAAGYDDSHWKKASVVPLDGTISRDISNTWNNMPMTDDYSGWKLSGQFGEEVWEINRLTAVSMEEVYPGVYIYDMGQNMVGIPHIRLSGMKPGTPVTIRYAEVKYPGLPEYKDLQGELMLENIRAAMAKDIYIARGGEEWISPRFTLHGYRFLEITGVDTAPAVQDVKGKVLSSVRSLASAYETSNQQVNKLWENITWSTYANFLSIPTDCAQRNERLGWGGDISVFSRTATYLSNMPQFLRRHMLNMRDVQREDGRFTDIAPLGGGFGGILWGSAGITVPWESYMQYGDVRMLQEHFGAMQAYIHYIYEKNINSGTGMLTQENPDWWGNLGDWLSPEDGRNEKPQLWEAYFIYDLHLMSRIATVLGKPVEAALYDRLCSERKEHFRKSYLEPATMKTIHSGTHVHGDSRTKGETVDTQTSYILPLVFDITADTEERDKLTDNLVETILRDTNRSDWGNDCPPYSLMTGFIGTAWINLALSENGRHDTAYRLLQNTGYPSWLYPVTQGATTIWERLNSYTHAEGFGGNNRMNSFNHYSFGAVGAWMYNHSLGIQRGKDTPAFKQLILAPAVDPTGEMTFAKGHYDSLYGRIESSWQKTANGYEYHFRIPANTTATIILPGAKDTEIKESGNPLKKAPGISRITSTNGETRMEAQSGEYHFSVTRK